MKLWLTRLQQVTNVQIDVNGDIYDLDIDEYPREYTGELPEHFEFLFAGMQWFVFRAISKIDAAMQAKRFDDRKHPLQAELTRICQTLRVLAWEDESKARTYFDNLYPVSLPNNQPVQQPVATIKLEAIGFAVNQYIANASRLLGENAYGLNKPWVAEIVGLDPKYKFKRSFLRGNMDFRESSGTGNRGVYLYFELRDGAVYEVKERLSWKHSVRYFVRAEKGKTVRIKEEEVIECLKSMGLA